MPGKFWWIKERHNPQFKQPYYVAYGRITASAAKAMEGTLYGENYMMKFSTFTEYTDKIAELKRNGFSVN